MIDLIFSSSNFYVPYLSVCLTSLREAVSDENDYTVTILEQDISERNKEILRKSGKDNLKIAFVDMRGALKGKSFCPHDHVSVETFFKLFIPDFFAHKDKVLFCDADVVFQDDPAKLYDIDLGDKKIAAAPCHLWNGIINENPKIRAYTAETLNVKNPDAYFQCGVLLYQPKRFVKDDFEKLSKMCARKLHCMDQDALNSCLQDDVFPLDSRWNYETAQKYFKTSIPCMNERHSNAWKAAKENPAVIHYSGTDKPWQFPDEQFAEIWWSFARKSPLYEECLLRLLEFRKQREKVTKRTVLCYKIMQKITFGKTRKKYKQKRRAAEKIIQDRIEGR